MANKQMKDKVDALFGEATRRGDIPGVAALVTDRQQNLYAGAFGERVLGSGKAMALDTVCWIASMTKPLTTVAVLQLVERGVIDLDVPAIRWLPQLAEAQVLEGFRADGQPRTRAPKRAISLRQLLTHTSGFGYEFWSADTQRFQAARKLPSITTCANDALMAPLLFDPGTRWEYGTGVDWAGKAVEAASGQRLGTYLREHVLAPLGMNDTSFKIGPQARLRLARLHQRAEDGSLAPIDLEMPQDPQFEMGGGGLYGSAEDYAIFVRMILNRGRHGEHQILKPECVDLMGSNQIGDLRVTALRTAMPSLTNDAEFFPGTRKTWGLGFQINMEPAFTGQPAGSMMWAGLANTYFWIDPANGIGGVYLTQIFPFADSKSLPLFYEFEKQVYDAST
ncbi:MAG TPA: serine hydrolase domain-containing protein [Burkholderiaceae bacterium]|nr:serine hydrolase domain-containing protein [Burkholderiaceae bacterium]